MSASTPIADFLARKRIAFVGVSRDPRDFSRTLFRDLLAHGYDLVPVHPGASEIEGRPCFARVQDVVPPVEGAFLMTPPSSTDAVVEDCAASGVRKVWMHRGIGRGAATPKAVERCRREGIEVVPGACPYMFLPGTRGPHRVHRVILRLLGRLPN